MLLSVALLMASTVASARTPAKYVGKQLDGTPCKGNYITFGPYDYLNRHAQMGHLQVVETSHFSPGVENLTKGVTTSPYGDLDYTLNAWPNHHRALVTAIKFREKHPQAKWPFPEKYPPAECFLQRAIAFSPRDGTPHLLYGLLLTKQKRYELALKHFSRASELLPGDVIPKYNTALTLVVLEKYARAKKIAVELYGNGFPLPGLKNQLIAVGYWEAESEADTDGDPSLETADDSTLDTGSPLETAEGSPLEAAEGSSASAEGSIQEGEAETTLESLITEGTAASAATNAMEESTGETSATGDDLVPTEDPPYRDDDPTGDSAEEIDTAQFLKDFSSAVETTAQPGEGSVPPPSPGASGD